MTHRQAILTLLSPMAFAANPLLQRTLLFTALLSLPTRASTPMPLDP
jgi:hypothetical protein